MTAGPRLGLLVVYTEHLEEAHRFFSGLGLTFVAEQHGSGPSHYAATLPDGTVFELCPADDRRPASRTRLGFHVLARQLRQPLSPGRHVLRDPDGRAVELYVG
ncbi:glyoxalase/bleomycin resistance/dioxygenase family protein [Streptomyces sp. PU-14G]|uniref:glyoxalase/bleomycin resistance/dioxygenase family protein n=1 Tax=Streptomyces sp. PU-14G TaxID=2800808 RepID=UPI0034DE3697